MSRTSSSYQPMSNLSIRPLRTSLHNFFTHITKLSFAVLIVNRELLGEEQNLKTTKYTYKTRVILTNLTSRSLSSTYNSLSTKFASK